MTNETNKRMVEMVEKLIEFLEKEFNRIIDLPPIEHIKVTSEFSTVATILKEVKELRSIIEGEGAVGCDVIEYENTAKGTLCPHGLKVGMWDIQIGSHACRECKSFKGNEVNFKSIRCSRRIELLKCAEGSVTND